MKESRFNVWSNKIIAFESQWPNSWCLLERVLVLLLDPYYLAITIKPTLFHTSACQFGAVFFLIISIFVPQSPNVYILIFNQHPHIHSFIHTNWVETLFLSYFFLQEDLCTAKHNHTQSFRPFHRSHCMLPWSILSLSSCSSIPPRNHKAKHHTCSLPTKQHTKKKTSLA